MKVGDKVKIIKDIPNVNGMLHKNTIVKIDEITDEWLAEAGERLRQRLLSHSDLETREMWKRVINRTPSASEGGTN